MPPGLLNSIPEHTSEWFIFNFSLLLVIHTPTRLSNLALGLLRPSSIVAMERCRHNLLLLGTQLSLRAYSSGDCGQAAKLEHTM